MYRQSLIYLGAGAALLTALPAAATAQQQGGTKPAPSRAPSARDLAPRVAIADAVIDATAPAHEAAGVVADALLDVAEEHCAEPAAAALVRLVERARDDGDRVAVVDRLEALARRPGCHGSVRTAARARAAELAAAEGLAERARTLHAATGWLDRIEAVGPFGDAGNDWLGVPFPPEFAFPTPDRRLRGRFGPVASRVLERDPVAVRFELTPPGRPDDSGCYYIRVRLVCDRPASAHLVIDHEGSYEVFVDGRRRGLLDRARERRPDRTSVALALSPGPHELLVKTVEADENTIGLRLVGGDAEPLTADRHGVRVLAAGETPPADAPPPAGAPVPADAPVPDEGAEPPTAAPLPGAAARLAEPVLSRSGAGQPPSPPDPAIRFTLMLGSWITALASDEDDLAWRVFDLLDRDDGLDDWLRAHPAHALALAARIQSLPSMPGSLADGRARAWRSLAAEAGLDATHESMLLQRAGELARDDEKEDALRMLEEALTDPASASPAVHDRRADLLEELEFEGELDRALELWARTWPHDARPWTRLARRRYFDTRTAYALLERALEAAPRDEYALRLMRDVACNLGETGTALACVEAANELERPRPGHLAVRAEVLQSCGRTQDAVPVLRRLVERHEHATPSDLRNAAGMLVRAREFELARTALRACLEARPDDATAQRMLARLTDDAAGAPIDPLELGAGEPYDEFAPLAQFFRTAEDTLAVFEPTERERTANSTLLLDQRIVRLRPDGWWVDRTHTIRRINDLAGVEEHQNATTAARADELERLRTLVPHEPPASPAADGEVAAADADAPDPEPAFESFVPRRVRGNLAMPRLEPGCFIEAVYRDSRRSPLPDPRRLEGFRFESADAPVLLSELVVAVEPGMDVDPATLFRMRGFDAETERFEVGEGLVVYRYRLDARERLATERLTPPATELVPVVTWGEDGDTVGAARSVRRRILRGTVATPPIVRATAAAIDGADEHATRIARIHDWVHAEIRSGGGGNDATGILLEKQGSQFMLEVAMLRAAGVHVVPALVMPERRAGMPGREPLFADEGSSGFPTVWVDDGSDAGLWLFSGPRYAPLGAIPEQLGDAAALLVEAPSEAGDGSLRVRARRLPPASEAVITGTRIASRLALGIDESVLEMRSPYAAIQGAGLAEQLRQVEDDRRQAFARQQAGRRFAGWRVAEAGFEGLEPPGSELALTARLTRRGLAQASGEGTLLASLPLTELPLQRYFADRAERELPLRLPAYFLDEQTARIEIGDRLRLASLPADVVAQTRLLDFELTFALDGPRTVVVHRSIRIRPGELLADEYPRWLAELQRLDDAQNVRLELVEVD